MLDATLRDRARGLLTASGRSDVPPFMVMDVMAAALRRDMPLQTTECGLSGARRPVLGKCRVK